MDSAPNLLFLYTDEQAMRTLAAYGNDRIAMPNLEPHMPFFGPRDGQYDPADVPLPPNAAAEPGPGQPLKARLLREHYRRKGMSGLPLRTDADWRRMVANHWGLCSLVDTHAGTILGAVDDCGLRERTIVTADGWKHNSSPLGEHELYNLVEDPFETQNLAGRAEHLARMRDLQSRIRAWRQRTGDAVR